MCIHANFRIISAKTPISWVEVIAVAEFGCTNNQRKMLHFNGPWYISAKLNPLNTTTSKASLSVGLIGLSKIGK